LGKLKTSAEVKNLKLKSILGDHLRELAAREGIDPKGRVGELVKKLLKVDEGRIDEFIKERYADLAGERRKQISDKELKAELDKVTDFSWGMVQGGLDQRIQREYVRQHYRYDDLLQAVKGNLQGEVESYVVCSWYNHWTTVLIEDHISEHENVIPTLKKVKGIDLFFRGQPFDLKTTMLPKGFELARAKADLSELAVWLYENQGEERFGDDPRFFVVLADSKNPDESWKLKRDVTFVFKQIDNFLGSEDVSEADQIVFEYGDETFVTLAKVLLVVREQ